MGNNPFVKYMYVLYEHMLDIWIGHNILTNTKVVVGHLGTIGKCRTFKDVRTFVASLNVRQGT